MKTLTLGKLLQFSMVQQNEEAADIPKKFACRNTF